MFTLDQVVPWGRSFDEYRRMFGLSEADLACTIVGCGDGPASFNAEARRRGARVVSCDPIYAFDAAQLAGRIAATYDTVVDQTRRNVHQFRWDGGIGSVEELGRVRLEAMQRFLDHYASEERHGAYVAADLPALPFVDRAFDLALCSHLLFLYSSELGGDLHRGSVREMCRVASEVRIFPLLTLGGTRSPFVEPCVQELRADGHEVSVESVGYEFQRGGNEMMRIR